MNVNQSKANDLKLTFDKAIDYLHRLSSEISMTNYSSESIDFQKCYPLIMNSGNDLRVDFEKVYRRMSREYRSKWYDTQILYYSITRMLFPKIVEFLPNMIHDDWLGSLSYKINNRDHIVHQPMVAYISNELLEMKIPNFVDKTLIDWLIEKIHSDDDHQYDYIRHYMGTLGSVYFQGDRKNNEEKKCSEKYDKIILKQIIQLTSTIASLYHDMGYSWQMINKLSKGLDERTNSVSAMFFDSDNFLIQHKDRMLSLPFKGYSVDGLISFDFDNMIRSIIEETHSLYSSLSLLRLKDSIAMFPQKPSMYNFCVEWAAMGILMHDMLKIYLVKDDKAISKKPVYPFLRLSFSKDPISTLLVLSDFLQEFERPRARFNVKDDKVTVEYDSNCKSCCLNIVGNTLKIWFKCDREDKYYKANLEQEKIKLFDRYYGFVDLSDIGIYEVEVEAGPKRGLSERNGSDGKVGL